MADEKFRFVSFLLFFSLSPFIRDGASTERKKEIWKVLQLQLALLLLLYFSLSLGSLFLSQNLRCWYTPKFHHSPRLYPPTPNPLSVSQPDIYRSTHSPSINVGEKINLAFHTIGMLRWLILEIFDHFVWFDFGFSWCYLSVCQGPVPFQVNTLIVVKCVARWWPSE